LISGKNVWNFTLKLGSNGNARNEISMGSDDGVWVENARTTGHNRIALSRISLFSKTLAIKLPVSKLVKH
jgi:hypothetical protein